MSNAWVWIALIGAIVAIVGLWALRDRLTKLQFKVGTSGVETSLEGAGGKGDEPVTPPLLGADGGALPVVKDAWQIAGDGAEIASDGPAVVERSKQVTAGKASIRIGGAAPVPPSEPR